ncbi:hypothetical protein GR925_02285 [Streptomyces sp. HUCO-GS316]|uniref:hypothetical protein n=1 Tax=Streptomyces sp. HUCO-GS316 TaxID=2692198 RepID=UPI00137001AA|nr:hypothetical protein [Streptomyces sp. HUCO-GS316]MXM62307.1 hypothetical protein [Streptomyces sp. HUCO-GS316]
MADMPGKGLSVYRLLPSLSEYQALHLGRFGLQRLKRWQSAGADADPPARLSAEWMGERRWPKSEFPSGRPGAPVLSRRLAESLGDALLAAGRLVPVDIEGAKDDEYFLYLVEQVVDCLDLRRSSKPKRLDGEVKKPVYRVEALPTHLPAFRLPQFPGAVQWNGWAVDRLVDLTGDQIEKRLTWSEAPSAKPHPDPWGF